MTKRMADKLRELLISGREDAKGGLVIRLDRRRWKQAVDVLADHHKQQSLRDPDFDAMPMGLS